MQSELLSKPEAARLLGGISVTTLDRLRAGRELVTIRVRGRVFVCARSLQAFLERQRRGAPPRGVDGERPRTSSTPRSSPSRASGV